MNTKESDFENGNGTTKPLNLPKMEVAETYAMMIWSEFSVAETAKSGLELIHKMLEFLVVNGKSG